MKFIDVCSGIGGFRSALENNGHECLAFAEIDKYAKQSYRAIYDTEGEIDLGDITAMSDEQWHVFKDKCDIKEIGEFEGSYTRLIHVALSWQCYQRTRNITGK